MTSSRLVQMSDEYETAEAAFLRAVTDGGSGAVLAELARTVAEAAVSLSGPAQERRFGPSAAPRCRLSR